jgi:hypothetical protein
MAPDSDSGFPSVTAVVVGQDSRVRPGAALQYPHHTLLQSI